MLNQLKMIMIKQKNRQKDAKKNQVFQIMKKSKIII